MRILQLAPRPPDPPTDGGKVVMLQIARALRAEGCEVDVLSLDRHKSLGRDALALLRAPLLRAPALVARFYSRAFARRIRDVAHGYDVVQVESPFLLPYLPVIRRSTDAAVVLRSLNVEFRIWEQVAAHKPIHRLIARGLRRYEIGHLNDCDALVPITEADAADFRQLGCTKPMHVLPGGVELGDVVPPPAIRAAGFLASLDYRPNQEAALWIAEELRPRLKGIELVVAGSNAPNWLRARLEAAGVTFLGRVPDAAAFLQSIPLLLAPILSGGGMRIKILDALAQARPVVSTTLGAAGIEVTHGRDILLADDADSFAAAVVRLLDMPSEAAAIGAAGRRLVASGYATDVLARGLIAFYEQLAQQRAGAHQ
jgi:glycosyltransferase involved in cell wall biosynthesis